MLKLQYSGHLMWRPNSSEKTLMLGKIEGRRKRGRERMRCLNGITDSIDMNLRKVWKAVKDREIWHAAVHGVTKSRTWLSNWTTTMKRNGKKNTFPFIWKRWFKNRTKVLCLLHGHPWRPWKVKRLTILQIRVFTGRHKEDLYDTPFFTVHTLWMIPATVPNIISLLPPYFLFTYLTTIYWVPGTVLSIQRWVTVSVSSPKFIHSAHSTLLKHSPLLLSSGGQLMGSNPSSRLLLDHGGRVATFSAAFEESTSCFPIKGFFFLFGKLSHNSIWMVPNAPGLPPTARGGSLSHLCKVQQGWATNGSSQMLWFGGERRRWFPWEPSSLTEFIMRMWGARDSN